MGEKRQKKDAKWSKWRRHKSCISYQEKISSSIGGDLFSFPRGPKKMFCLNFYRFFSFLFSLLFLSVFLFQFSISFFHLSILLLSISFLSLLFYHSFFRSLFLLYTSHFHFPVFLLSTAEPALSYIVYPSVDSFLCSLIVYFRRAPLYLSS